MKLYPTPMLDALEDGPWPSFVTGLKKMRDEHPDERINNVINGLMGQLEHSYETRMGYWKGGTISVFGYGGGIIPRFSEVGDQFPESREFHTLRVQPTPGNYYSTGMMRQYWQIAGRSGGLVYRRSTDRLATSCLSVLIVKASSTSLMKSTITVGILVVRVLVFVQQCLVWVLHVVSSLVVTSTRFTVI